jgi:hypothetical protein
LQEEVEIVKNDTASKNIGSGEKAQKIDQLIQNYSICLSEKRALMKKNVGLRLKDIQDRKFTMKASVISKA